MTTKKLRALMNNPGSAVQLRFGNETALAAEVTEILPQALKRDPRTDGSYARLKGVLHPSPIHQM
jgi:hypothetical protein